MKHKKVKTRLFTPPSKNKGQNCAFNIVLCFSLLALSGCSTTEKPKPLAPDPPAVNTLLFSQQSQILYQPYYFAAPPQEEVNEQKTIPPIIKSDASKSADQRDCSFKEKLDRKYLLAYEWGRSKLSMDIDGINMKPSSEKALRIEYKIRFQPEKTKKQLCRYPSNWQGLIGSSYNEFIIQKKKIPWRDIIKIM